MVKAMEDTAQMAKAQPTQTDHRESTLVDKVVARLPEALADALDLHDQRERARTTRDIERRDAAERAAEERTRAVRAAASNVYELDPADLVADDERRRIRAIAEIDRLYAADNNWRLEQASWLVVDTSAEPGRDLRTGLTNEAWPTRADGDGYRGSGVFWSYRPWVWLVAERQMPEVIVHSFINNSGPKRVLVLKGDAFELFTCHNGAWIDWRWRDALEKHQAQEQEARAKEASERARYWRRALGRQLLQNNPELVFDLAVDAGLVEDDTGRIPRVRPTSLNIKIAYLQEQLAELRERLDKSAKESA